MPSAPIAMYVILFCSRRRVTKGHTAGKEQQVICLPSTYKIPRTLIFVSEACRMTAHCSTRDSLHHGCRNRCRRGRCLVPSSGIARYDVAVRETAARRHCAHSTSLQTTIGLTSRTTPWRNSFHLHKLPRGTALRGRCLCVSMTPIPSSRRAAPRWWAGEDGDRGTTQVSVAEPMCDFWWAQSHWGKFYPCQSTVTNVHHHYCCY